MNRTPIVLIAAAALLAACSKPEEDLASGAGAATVNALEPGIYDGDGAVLQVSAGQNGNVMYSFAHAWRDRIVKGQVEAKKGETPKLVSDELYPCGAELKVENGKVVATGSCRTETETRKAFSLNLTPRVQGKLKGSFVKDGHTVTIGGATNDLLKVTISDMPAAGKGEWIYGGGVYRASFGECTVHVIVRSAAKDHLLDVGGNAKNVSLDVRGSEEACKGLTSGLTAAR